MSKIADRISSWLSRRAIPILCYHSIPEGSRFRAQMSWIRATGYRVIALDELCKWVQSSWPLHEPALVLTFDDCYLDQFANAVPLLVSFKYPAAFFAVSKWVTCGYDRPNRVNAPIPSAGLMGPAELSEVRRLGFTIGCHGRTHTPFSMLSSEAQLAEMSSSKMELEELLKEQIRFFCFPYGHHSTESTEHLKTSGFQAAVSTRVGAVRPHDNVFTLARLCISASATPDELSARLTWMPPAAELIRKVPGLESLARAMWRPA